MTTATERTLLETVVQQMPIGVVLLEAPSGRVILANDEYERLLGRRAPATVLGDGPPGVFRPDGTPVVPGELPAARTLREKVRCEAVLLCDGPGGATITLRVRAEPIFEEEALAAVLVLFDDVSRAEARERAERDFVTNAAHELQSPIAAVMAAADALEAGAKHDPRERDRFIRHILDACARLARLTQALLVLARVQTGAEAAKVELVPLCPLLSDVVAGQRAREGVELSVACPDGLAALATPVLLEQAIANLLSNAVKHTDSGRVAVTAERRGRVVAISVADTGRGIPRGDQERIRRRFARSSEDQEGSGLGLAIADQAVSAMNGELHIESELGRGTTVTLVLAAATMIRS